MLLRRLHGRQITQSSTWPSAPMVAVAPNPAFNRTRQCGSLVGYPLLGRSPTIDAERERLDDRRSQFDPEQTVGLLRNKRSTKQINRQLRRAARRPQTIRTDPSLDHFVGAQQHPLRDRQVQRLGCPQVGSSALPRASRSLGATGAGELPWFRRRGSGSKAPAACRNTAWPSADPRCSSRRPSGCCPRTSS